ncbi:uncharacterized protein N7500_006532 [Penicillium coprophilum]|uniref:uncharacterized protein n=1 Tax=Penicillium coprophilum TaxID=36646 RepID=UPI00239A0A6E|nr:uncharacterized protein N7500_006532 [Penicillium coprophilum]KAJ5164702.1 hypothetical protein N7500_006532 [Penicillium coprophilum]
MTTIGSNNWYYIGIALYRVPYPIPPLYEDTGNDYIHKLLIEEGVIDIDTTTIRARGREVVEDNKRLIEIY